MLNSSHIPLTLISSILSLFFFNDPATTEIYTLSLHDALPIWDCGPIYTFSNQSPASEMLYNYLHDFTTSQWADYGRSEEHTSELQSRQYLVCRLLLEKKKNKIQLHD